MIVYELRCAEEHGFEGWFRNSEAFDQQADCGQVECPVCGSTEVRKAPMAPRIGKGAAELEAAQRAHDKLGELCRQVEQKCVYVGTDFAEEARKIHYGEVEQRDIYGEASAEEAESLRDEGVAFAAIPWVNRDDA
ncbi:DUF1178 family protein [Roseiterribacter gracilis]|uniref:Uncharacterized protein n=1 Tax=Roseiterribacter gracilis TaxID=2812848 RepID=A0A8S8XJ93_9PROT|nr:hypothetical protein TMPK1_34930 [Rhodospirillales bacterium TMPK1]